MNQLNRLKWLFACLYFVQGAAISYFSIFQKPYLNSLGIERGQIGLLNTLLLLPFIFKIFFGWLSDRFPVKGFGRRKPYMLIGLSIASAAFLLTCFFTPDKTLLIYSFLVLSASLGVSFFDAATDGLAVDRVPSTQQGSVQAYMVSGKAVGVILLSISIGHIVTFFGQKAVFAILGLVFWFPLFLTWKIKVTEDDLKVIDEDLGHGAGEILKTPLFLMMGLLAISYSFVSFGNDGLITLYLSDYFGLSNVDIGHYGSLRGVGAIIGSLICGKLFVWRKESEVTFLGLVLVGLGVSVVGLALNKSNFLLIAPLWGVIWGFQEVCFLTLAMNIVGHHHSALAFALLMALSNVGTAIGDGLATTLTKYWTYQKVFLFLAACIFIPLLVLSLVGRMRRKLGST
jgi:PAT family beta-lactamase induction signal transducer AmpG